jgi:vacuolar-type H+-ATPase subunit H
LKPNGSGSYKDLGEEIGLLLQHAKDRARHLEKGAEEEAALILSKAKAESERLATEAEHLLTTAKKEADRIRSEINEQAARSAEQSARSLEAANAKASVLRAEGKRAADQLMKRAKGEATRLRSEAEHQALTRVRELEKRVVKLQQMEAVLKERLRQQGAVSVAPGTPVSKNV